MVGFTCRARSTICAMNSSERCASRASGTAVSAQPCVPCLSLVEGPLARRVRGQIACGLSNESGGASVSVRATAVTYLVRVCVSLKGDFRPQSAPLPEHSHVFTGIFAFQFGSVRSKFACEGRSSWPLAKGRSTLSAPPQSALHHGTGMRSGALPWSSPSAPPPTPCASNSNAPKRRAA